MSTIAFGLFAGQPAPFLLPLAKLYGWRPKVIEVLADLDAGRVSHSTGQSIVVSRLDAPRGAYFILDGYHRAMEAIRRGERTIPAVLDVYVPRIERTGGAHARFVAAKVRLVDMA